MSYKNEIMDGLRSPRLRISHLLLLIASSAVFLAISRNGIEMLQSLESGHLPAERVVGALKAVVCGIAVTALVIQVMERIRGNQNMFSQPGHWLLLAMTPPISLSEPLRFAQIYAHENTSLSVLFDVSWCLSMLIVTVILLFALRCIIERRWKFAMAGLAAATAFNAFSEFVFVLEPFEYGYGWLITPLIDFGNWITFAALASVGIVAAAELSSGTKRDWLHWIGVGICFSPLVLMMIEEASL